MRVRRTIAAAGGALLAMGATDWETTQRALELCPSYRDIGFAEAEANCLDAIQRTDVEEEPQLAAKLLEGLASLYRSEGRTAEAITALQRSLDLTPELPHNAATALATLLEQDGRLGEAGTLLEALIEKRYAGEKSRGQTWMRGAVELQLGNVNRKMGETAKAEDYYRKSVRDLARGPGDDPTYAAAARLVNLYLSEGRVAEAKAACDSWTNSVPPGSPTAVMCERLSEATDSPNGADSE